MMTRNGATARSFRVLATVVLVIASVTAAAAGPRHGVSMYGDLKYGPDFTHFAYADPEAPKGGLARFEATGTFDSLNPFILQGTPAAGLAPLGNGLVHETLTAQSLDEPFSEYGLLAKTIEVPIDRSYVRYTLRPEARWQDGRPVTPEDVVWTFDTLMNEGTPVYRQYYANVASVEKTGERQVTFAFDGTVNRELPLIVGQMPVLPRHHFEGRPFDEANLTPPLGSGPYRVGAVDAGRSITYERVRDYWGADLPVNTGRNNFDTIRYEYYRDDNVALEAFKAGRYDLRAENTARLWATGYAGPALNQGLIVKEELPQRDTGVMQGFVYNTRRPVFRDPRVRRALAYAFDFEWTNKNLFYGQYRRIDSYFSNTELASTGLPGPEELKLLEPLRASLPPEVFTATYRPPSTNVPGGLRANLRTALEMLRAAGYEVRDGAMVEAASGRPLAFEIIESNPAFERILLPFIQNLGRLGIRASLRTVEPAQYQNRINDFDFDMTVSAWGQSLSPGNEQREYWGSAAAEQPGSRNLAGVRDPAVDALVQKVITAPSREDLVTATRALDRVLLWGHYVIPNWRSGTTNVAYWDRFGRPSELPRQGIDLQSWWIDPVKAAALERRSGAPSD